MIGFLLTCALAFIAIRALKFEYDANFTEHYRQIQTFTHIKEIQFSHQDEEKVQKLIKQMRISLTDLNLFFKLHNLYQKFFLPQSYEYLQKLYERENQILKEFYAQTNVLDQLTFHSSKKDASPQKIQAIQKQITTIKSLISELLEVRLKTAESQRKTINSIYEVTCSVLFCFAFIVLLTTIISVLNILSAINKYQEKLEQIIEDKTLKLKTINQNLKKTIKNEVESSRKKDQIMYQQDRLASMGEMIQNIAHQWRQPLNSLVIIIQSFRTKFHHQKLTEDFINSQTEYGLQVAKNMSETIENFRHFFQPNKLKEHFSLQESIQDSIKLIQFILTQNNIQITLDLKTNRKIYGYKNSFSQIILNLLKNTQDAIIERKVKKGYCYILLEEKCDKIHIVLKDNAGGIKEKRLDRVFEPYFTTKHKSVGTGIGLFMTKEIIEKQMHGSITVTNAHWNLTSQQKIHFYGAMFIIELPIKSE